MNPTLIISIISVLISAIGLSIALKKSFDSELDKSVVHIKEDIGNLYKTCDEQQDSIDELEKDTNLNKNKIDVLAERLSNKLDAINDKLDNK
jgi:peptidoglycan hydrolase CwlO-like protein